MKKVILALLSVLAVLAVFAYPVRIQSWDIDNDIKVLNNARASIDYVNRTTGVIIVYVRNSGEEESIKSLGYSTERVPEPDKEYAARLWEETKDSKDPMNAYYSLAEYQSFMQNTAAQYPAICQLVTIGNSANGNPLMYLKITDNVSLNENEPEFRYVSSIHGDEVVGYDMMIRLIQLLTTGYGTDTRITNIVNNAEIWINPMYNPDGYQLQQRFNAAGIDLNRNLPMPTGEQHPDGNVWGVENIAFMNFANSKNFGHSINFHGGALVINYPWDYTYTLAPDNSLLIDMSLAYSTTNTAMYNGEFNQGITNGAAWYVITGSLQDWNYGLTDCIDITAEISNIKWPNATTLDSYWNQNRESILNYMEYALKGLHGLVTDSSGNPLDAAIVVSGNSRITHTDPSIGDYHRLLLGGTYSVTAQANGFIPQTQSITIPAGGAASLNFSLEPAQQISFMGIVRDQNGFAVPQAQVTIGTEPPLEITTAVDGSFIIPSIYEGNYSLVISASGSPQLNTVMNALSNDNRQVFILTEPIFTEDFESGIGNWTATSPWAITTESGNSVLKDSPSGNYANNINKNVKLTSPLDLSSITNPQLQFRAKYALESGYDFVRVEASATGTSWTELASFTGNQSNWQNYNYSLNPFAGGPLHLRFRITTDSGVTADGITIDDIVITGMQSNLLLAGDVNTDGRISRNDIDRLMLHCADMDEEAWTTAQTQAADVDANGSVDELDAYLIHKYMTLGAYRLPVQTGVPEQFPSPQISYAIINNQIQINANPQGDLRSLSISFAGANTSISNVSITGALYHTVNLNDKYIGLVTEGNALQISFNLTSPSFPVIASGLVNGSAYQISINTGSSADDDSNPAVINALNQNYPNPFNPSTIISYSIKEADQMVRLDIYNARGQLVKTLVNQIQASGNHHIVWNGTDEAGEAVSAGLYLYRLKTPSFDTTRRMVLLK